MSKRKVRKRKVHPRPKRGHRPPPPSRSKGTLGLWIEELRAPFFTATIVPVLLGIAIAWASEGMFDLFLFILTLAGVLCIHAGTNIANDYFDHKSGNDEVNVEYIRPFTGGSRLIQKGLLEANSVLRAAIMFLAIGSIIGLVLLVMTNGLAILILGIIGVGSGLFYTAPPISLADRGLGEVFVGLNCGILLTLGAFYVQTRFFTMEAFVASLPVALLIFQVIYVNEFPDYKADRAVGKRTLVVRLGRRRAVKGHTIMAMATYVTILGAVALEIMPQVALIAIVTAPLAVISTRELRKNYGSVQALGPVCGRTVLVHLATGALLIIAYVIDGSFLHGGGPF